MKKLISYIIHPKKIIIYLMNKNLFWFINDKQYLKWKYKLIMDKELNLDNPATFNEKLQWLKLYDRREEYVEKVDKAESKKVVGKIIGEKYIIPTLGIYNSFDEINFTELPNQFVIKPTQTSGNVYICKDKTKIDYRKLKKTINKWLRRDYYKVHREWPYKNIKPRIIIEKYMGDNNGFGINDYKFMCFNGDVKCSFVCTERGNKDSLKVTFFDKEWNKMPFERHYPSSKNNIEKPKNYGKMIELAEKLSVGIPFVRVDFYNINGDIYFGELTFYPGSGYEEFTPECWDYKLGELIDLQLVKGNNYEK